MFSLFVLTIIAITLFGVLRPYLTPIILVFALPIVIGFIYFRFISNYFASQRGYQDRYTRQGQEFQGSLQIIRWLLLLGGIFVLYSLVSSTLSFFTGTADETLVFGITAVVAVGFVQYMDYYTSKDMVEYVSYKDKQHRQFVESLGKAENICMSCRRKMEQTDLVCSHCGYRRKEIQGSSEYLE